MTAIEREQKYWDGRYALGYASGRPPREIDERNKLLWAAVEEELPEIDHVIDVGCGDLRIWGDRDCQDYVGIDIAREVLQDNKNVRRPHWKFLCAPAERYITDLVRENVFCFNLMFHILHPDNARRIFYNLCRYASKRIFIHTMISNPILLERDKGEEYQMYHPMGRYLPLFNEMGFELISVEWIEQPGLSKKITPCGLYIFRKKA